MNSLKKIILFALAIFFVLNFNGCSDDKSEPAPVLPELDRIVISSTAGKKLDLNEKASLTITAFDQFNDPFTLTETIIWSSDNDHVNVDQTGEVTGISVGVSIITAKVLEKETTITVTVWDSSAPRTEIYVSDASSFQTGPWKILKYDGDGKNPETFINQNLGWPQDIVFLADQEVVLISNLNTGRITKYNANSGEYISDFASGIGGPTRMKIGADNLLYVLQWQGNGKVFRYQLDGTFVDQFTSVGVNESIGLDWDSSGNLYVSSFNGGSGGYVRKFDSSGNDQGVFISSGLQGPTNIWFDVSGNLMVNDWQGGAIRKFSSSGVFISNFATGLSQVEGVDFLDNGDVLIGNGGTSAVKQFTSSGSFVKDLVTSKSGGLIKPNAVVIRRVN